MKKFLFIFSAILSIVANAAPLEGWTEDLEKALAQAKKEKKMLLVEFTGSDWCPPCMMMRKNVFSKKEFVEKAAKNFILVEIDFPKGDEALAKKHEPLSEKYKIEGYPTVIILDAEAKELNRFYASEYPEQEKFLAHLNQIVERKNMD